MNRGIFTLSVYPEDSGHTYSCGRLPTRWGIAGIDGIRTAAPEVGIKLLDEFIGNPIVRIWRR